jgi:hypothetical protein
MRSFHFAIELLCLRFDINVPNPFVLDVPMELCLKLMTAVRADCVDAKWIFVDGIVNEVHRVGLIVTAVKFESSNAVASSIAVY